MSNPDSPLFVDMSDILPDFEKASSLVKEAGGMVFVPHIFEYRKNSEKILNYILCNYQFDGFECYYRNFTKEQTAYLLSICADRNLFSCGGSDYHGRVKPHVAMGTGEGNLCVPDDIVQPWVKFTI